MAYNPPVYPTDIPTAIQLPDRSNYTDVIWAKRYNELKKELRAVMIELGTLPKGGFGTVKQRLINIYPQFHDRGDPAAYDYTSGDLTTDGTWQDLDVSAIAPAGAKAVILKTELQSATPGDMIMYREKGNVNEINACACEALRANVVRKRMGFTAISTARVMQYKADNIAWTTLNIVIRGWWK